ncbi:hypothetical protein L6164_036152 [Bauhinia variegata]|uniref:Uncharacterized protein n=1 Tax=Bauhinia variegata TaxID=167791 RepID=A0ACB9KGZ1_BAUVA|nr:hypothetical protein L6164_036152 [Bauhinia variegata]
MTKKKTVSAISPEGIGMSAIPRSRSLNFLVFFVSCSLQLILGFSDDKSGSQNDTKPETHTTSRRSTNSMVAIILVVLVVVGLFSCCLFKLWQKKRREEQYARLLKLFEEDDELELELGLRD